MNELINLKTLVKEPTANLYYEKSNRNETTQDYYYYSLIQKIIT